MVGWACKSSGSWPTARGTSPSKGCWTKLLCPILFRFFGIFLVFWQLFSFVCSWWYNIIVHDFMPHLKIIFHMIFSSSTWSSFLSIQTLLCTSIIVVIKKAWRKFLAGRVWDSRARWPGTWAWWWSGWRAWSRPSSGASSGRETTLTREQNATFASPHTSATAPAPLTRPPPVLDQAQAQSKKR